MARDRQRERTRKDLLRAAARLAADGATPTLEEVAEAAQVSRATAYRYFPGVEALLVEAALDIAAPEPAILLGEGAPKALEARLAFVDEAFARMIARHETPLRTMLVHALQHALKGEDLPVRQNRRLPMIEAAIADADERVAPEAQELLAHAMALVVGTESMIVFKDVLRLDDAEAARVRRWAIRAFAAAALAETPIAQAAE